MHKHWALGNNSIYIDNKTNLNIICKYVTKERDITYEAGAIITVIKQETESTSIEITFEYSNNISRSERIF